MATAEEVNIPFMNYVHTTNMAIVKSLPSESQLLMCAESADTKVPVQDPPQEVHSHWGLIVSCKHSKNRDSRLGGIELPQIQE
jgi:hypothetical protein